MLVLSIVSDKYFEDSEFDGEEYKFEMDADEGSTVKELVEVSISMFTKNIKDINFIDIEFSELSKYIKAGEAEKSLYLDFEIDGHCVNVNIDEW